MHHIIKLTKKDQTHSLSLSLTPSQTHIQQYRKNKHVKHFISKASSSNCSGFLTLHWLFSIYFSKLLFFLNPLPWKKNQQKHSHEHKCIHAMDSMANSSSTWWCNEHVYTYIRTKCTMHNVGCTARRRRKKDETKGKKNERMTYTITENLCVALKLFTKKTTPEHWICATVVAYFALENLSCSVRLVISLFLPIIYIPSIKWNTNKYIIKSSHTLFHGTRLMPHQTRFLFFFCRSWGWGGFVSVAFYAAKLLLLLLAWIFVIRYRVRTWSSIDDDMMKLVCRVIMA